MSTRTHKPSSRFLPIAALTLAASFMVLITSPQFRAFKRDFYLKRVQPISNAQLTSRETILSLASNYAKQGNYALAGSVLTAISPAVYHYQGEQAQNLLKAGNYFLKAKNIGAAQRAFDSAMASVDTPDRFEVQKRSWNILIENGQTDLVKRQLDAAAIAKPYKTLVGRRHYLYNIQETFRVIGDSENAELIEDRLEDKHCPLCASDKLVRPVYEVIRPSCIQSPWDAKWWCTRDKVEF